MCPISQADRSRGHLRFAAAHDDVERAVRQSVANAQSLEQQEWLNKAIKYYESASENNAHKALRAIASGAPDQRLFLEAVKKRFPETSFGVRAEKFLTGPARKE